MSRRIRTIGLWVLPLLFPLSVHGEVTVTIENLSSANGGFLTPVWVGFHDGNFDIYDIGAPASPGLESLAEDGTTETLAAEFGQSGAGVMEGTIFGPGGPLGPGDVATMTFPLDEDSAPNLYFSFASMVIPSNDAFIANEGSRAHPVFDGLGNFIGRSFIIVGKQVRDAGTEVNDEVPMNTAFLAQMAPNTGLTEGGTVMPHPGFAAPGSGGILDVAMFGEGDFTLPGYAVARITLTFDPGTTLDFDLSSGQAVPTNDSTAIGDCHGVLNPAQTEFHVRCDHNVEQAVAAHIHRAGAGMNGGILFDLGDPANGIDAVWQPTPDEVEDLLAGNLYVNVHSPTVPAGEIRGQIDGCFDGPTTLCLNEDRFEARAHWRAQGQEGEGRGVELTDDSGHLWFFSETNIELVVKVLNACVFANRYWVFAGGLTNVEVDLEVTDTATGETRSFHNDEGNPFGTILDTEGFATCP